MGTVYTAAEALDTAIGSFNTALATFMADVATARSTAILAAAGPTGGKASIPRFEDVGQYVRAVIGQTALTATLLNIPVQNTSVTVAGQFLSTD